MHRLTRFLAIVVASTMTAAMQAQTSRSGSAPSAAALDTFQEGTAALRANHPDQAITAFEQVTQESPRFAEAFLNLGLALSQEQRNDEALQALSKAVALKPSLRGAHLFLAIAQYRLNRFEAASASVRRESAMFPGDAQAWMWQGIIDLAQDHLTSAVDALDKAAAIDPANIDVLYHRGHAALALSRQSYEKMFQLDPHSWHVHQVLAQADVDAGRDAEAVEEYKLAIAAAPSQSGLYEALGSSLWKTGRFEEAEAAFQTALKIDPGDTLTMYKLGCLRVDRSNAADAKPLLLKVLAADSSLKLTRYYLGRAEMQLGNNQAAVDDFKQTIGEQIDDDTTRQSYFQLSRAYRRLHDTAASNAAQEQYRSLDQKTREAQQEKLAKRQLREDRDTSIPSPPPEAQEQQP